MEDHTSDQATARDELEGARVLPRRSTRVDVQDPDFKYTAWQILRASFPVFWLFMYVWVCGGVTVVLDPSKTPSGPYWAYLGGGGLAIWA